MSPQAQQGEGDALAGNERFAVQERLGAGATCVVYRVRDRQHGDVVALKTLRHLDPSSLYRLKQEFRALSQLDHPNLVSFYELVHEADDWFVTMELVEGVDFLTWCRGCDDARPQVDEEPAAASSSDLRFAQSAPAGRAANRDNRVSEAYRPRPDGRLPDVLRLRSSLRQVAEGVAALHDAGRIHRDLKPSNVLVTEAGRVVILDFGLVAEIDQDYTEGTLHQNIAGSAAYMSPEQSVGRPLTPASDWYGVGVMLYEALTGVWPYSGHLYDILNAKQQHDPPRPRDLVADVPEDLDELCMALLRREPLSRPTGAEVVERLRSQRAVAPRAPSRPVHARFRFREAQIERLNKALQSAGWGRPVVALVRGTKGAGKTLLLREFVKQVKRREPRITLKGRCYRWEQVPFEALDGIVDNLSRVLRRAEPDVLRRLEGPAFDHLAGLFPVLGRVRAIDVNPVDVKARPDEALSEATAGLQQVLRELAVDRPPVLVVDDAQWGDLQSAGLLTRLLDAPDLPLLLVVSYDSREPGPLVEALIPALQQQGVELAVIDVEPLGVDEAAALAAELLGRRPDDEQVRALAVQSGGVPAVVRELARRAGRGRRPVLEVNEVVVSRVAGLPDATARLLAVLAVAGEPLPTGVAIAAAGLGGEAFAAITTLRALQLVEVDGDDGPEGVLELPGEPLREHVLDRLSDEDRRVHHRALARVLEEVGGARPEALVEHYAAAGESGKAAMVAWMAADVAARSLAWDAAVWLLQRALEYGQWSTREQQALKGQLGQALAVVGRGREAARIFLQAADDAPRLRIGPLRLQAAEQLLVSGHVDEGLPILDGLLRDVGVGRLPRRMCISPLTAVRRWRLWLRGAATQRRMAAEVDADRLLRVDACCTAAEAVLLVDPALGACMQPLHLREALELGEPERVVRALAAEVTLQGALEPGGQTWRETWSRARAIAEEIGSPAGVARTTAAAGVAAYHSGLWAEAARLCAEAEEALHRESVGVGWERFRARLILGRARLYQGELRAAAAGARQLLETLEHADDLLFGTLVAGSLMPLVRMAEDDPDAGVRDLERFLGRWSHAGYHVQHAWGLLARVRVDLYRGRAGYAWERLLEQWRALIRSGALLDPVLRNEAWLLRATTAVAVSAEGEDRSRDCRAALRQIRRDGQAWAQPWANLVAAGLARVQGGDDWEGLEAARRAFDDGGMALGSALAVRALGRDGAGGQPSLRWLRDQGVRDPERFARALAPGL